MPGVVYSQGRANNQLARLCFENAEHGHAAGGRWRDEDGVGLLIVERSDCDLIICDGASVISA